MKENKVDKQIKSMEEVDFGRFVLPIIAVYESPKDYPGCYIARVFDVDKPTNIIMAKASLEELQQDIKKHAGMFWIQKSTEDDPAIIGTWI